MSDPFQTTAFLDGIGQLKQSLNQGQFVLPFGAVDPYYANVTNSSPYIRLEIFGPRYDKINSGGTSDLFCNGWEVRATETLDVVNLYAMTVGSIHFDTIFVDGSPVSRLILGLADFLQLEFVKRRNHLPPWFPMMQYIIYENVDEADVRTKMEAHLSANETIKKNTRSIIRNAIGDQTYDGPVTEMVEAFISGQVAGANTNLTSPLHIEVGIGTEIGKMATSDVSAERKCTIQMVEKLVAPENTFYLNPSYYLNCLNHANELSVDLSGHPFETKLLETTEPVSSKGIVRFVGSTGTDQPAGTPDVYLTPATAARTITAAISAANEGDCILITDNAAYAENEITIDKSIALCGLNRIPHGTLLKDHADDNDLPHVQGLTPANPGEPGHRVLYIRNNSSEGMIYLGHLVIENGSDSGEGGGGIAIDGFQLDECRAMVCNCLIQNNQTTGGASAFVHGFGGGIMMKYSSPLIYGCIIQNNLCNRRGGGIGSYGYGWPSIVKNKIHDNQSRLVGAPATFDGGGIAIVMTVPIYQTNAEAANIIASIAADQGLDAALDPEHYWDTGEVNAAKANVVQIAGNSIQDNYSVDDGGGVYFSVMVNVLLKDNIINGNYSASNGGGVRATFGCNVTIEGGEIRNNRSNWNKDTSQPELVADQSMPAGGGVSSRNATIILRNVVIDNNVSEGWAGGGVYFISSDAGQTSIGIQTIDWMPVARRIFGLDKILLSIENCTIINNRATFLNGQNSDHGKGGGVYVWRMSAAELDSEYPGHVSDPDYRIFKLEVKIDPAWSIEDNNSGTFPGADKIYLDDPEQTTVISDALYDTYSTLNYTNNLPG